MINLLAKFLTIAIDPIQALDRKAGSLKPCIILVGFYNHRIGSPYHILKYSDKHTPILDSQS